MLLLALMPACAVNHRPPATVASIQADAAGAAAAARTLQDTVTARLARRVVARGDRTLDILLLSGGGQNGAYGVGFLRGWRTRPDAPMPKFDLVTGISTGALQAPFALLGSEAALDTVAALYHSAATRIAPKLDLFFWLRKTGGVVKTAQFRHTLATVLDSTMAAALRREFAVDRQIVIGTTDFDLGVARAWDLGHELGSATAGRERVQTLLLASSSIPSIFPPIVIDGHVHADGGVMGNTLPLLDLEGYRRLAARLNALNVGGPVTVRLWVVMNVWSHAPPAVLQPSSRGAMSQRLTTLLFLGAQPQLLGRLAELSRAVSSDVPGLRMEYRMTAIPAALASEPAATSLVNPAWMLRLDRLGYERAHGDTPWDAVPTIFERPR